MNKKQYRYDRNKRQKKPRKNLNCGPGSKQCGNACISNHEKCRFGPSKEPSEKAKNFLNNPKVKAVMNAVANGKTSVTDIADALNVPNPKASQIIDFVLGTIGVPNIASLASGAVSFIKRMFGMRTDSIIDTDPDFCKAFLRAYYRFDDK